MLVHLNFCGLFPAINHFSVAEHNRADYKIVHGKRKKSRLFLLLLTQNKSRGRKTFSVFDATKKSHVDKKLS
jgi:hypothetical protein